MTGSTLEVLHPQVSRLSDLSDSQTIQAGDQRTLVAGLSSSVASPDWDCSSDPGEDTHAFAQDMRELCEPCPGQRDIRDCSRPCSTARGPLVEERDGGSASLAGRTEGDTPRRRDSRDRRSRW